MRHHDCLVSVWKLELLAWDFNIIGIYVSLVQDLGWDWLSVSINSSPPGQNGRHFTDDIFKCIVMNEKICILIRISLKFVPKGPINIKSGLVEIMAWCQTGDKPLSEPVLTQVIDVCTRGRWVKYAHNGQCDWHSFGIPEAIIFVIACKFAESRTLYTSPWFYWILISLFSQIFHMVRPSLEDTWYKFLILVNLSVVCRGPIQI